MQSLANVGRGVPDLLVGFRGLNFLVEVKDGSKPPSARKLTDDEKLWQDYWKQFGQVETVENAEQALAVIGVKVSA